MHTKNIQFASLKDYNKMEQTKIMNVFTEELCELEKTQHFAFVSEDGFMRLVQYSIEGLDE